MWRVESGGSAGDRLLVSGGDDDTVRIWDSSSWQPIVGHNESDGKRRGSLTTVAASPRAARTRR